MPQCRCCYRENVGLNDRGLCVECAVCLHCETRSAWSKLGLCVRCHGTPGFRRLYLRHRSGPGTWNPKREQRVRRLTARFQIGFTLEELFMRPPSDLSGPIIQGAVTEIVRRASRLRTQLDEDSGAFCDDALAGVQDFLETCLALPDLAQQFQLERILAELADQLRGIAPGELERLPVLREMVTADLQHARNQLERLDSCPISDPVCH